MKPPTIHQRTYWVAVKATHHARLTRHPGARVEAMAALRNHARADTTDPRILLPQLTRLEERHGPHQRRDSARMCLWPDRRTVARYRRSYARTDALPDFRILDEEG